MMLVVPRRSPAQTAMVRRNAERPKRTQAGERSMKQLGKDRVVCRTVIRNSLNDEEIA